LVTILFLNFLKIDKLNIYLNKVYFFYYLVIPGILLISSFDISFHYDAGYYHLNTQNWLRESKTIFGFVNIFWPFGMASIYEYLSAILWLDNRFLYLHLIDIIFIHFFYIFIVESFLNPKYKEYKFMSIFLVLFSILDNFGVGGGRNGYIYFQGVGKQDIPLAILFFFISFTIFILIKYKNISILDASIISIFCLFIFQLKVSSAIIFFLLGLLLYRIFYLKILSIGQLFKSQLLFLSFTFFWFLKTYITTGCVIFPLSITCLNNFSWYISGSTESFEYISKQASLNYDIRSLSFSEWYISFISYEINRVVLSNFLMSIFLLGLIKILLFKKKKESDNFLKVSLFSFILLNIFYLIFFGPIPRYSIGIMLVIVTSYSFFINKIKYNIKLSIFILFALFSVISIVRTSSYQAFLNGEDHNLFNPSTYFVINEEIGFTRFNESWVFPSQGDQCWTNLECSMAKSNIKIEEGFIKTAYNNNN
tara:strand:- start:4454 stop:5890 length:1437 start_codon:yes stop_codon:yes gene_type:complete